MDKNKFWIKYKTGTNNIYPIEMGFKRVFINDIIYQPQIIRNLCKVGCKNYNNAGGCPPRAPLFEELIEGIKSIFLVYGTFWPEYKTKSVKKSLNVYVHFRLQDQILSRILFMLGSNMREKYGALFLGAGYCMGCKSRKCNFKVGFDFCKNPKLRTFSMEATGINVSQTLINVFGIRLSWYKKGQELNIPMTKCIAILFKEEVTQDQFNKYINEIYNYKLRW